MFDEIQASQEKIEQSNLESEKLIDRNTAGIVLKVIGVGGAGNNAIQMMKKDHFKNVEFIVANTDAQALASNDCQNQIPLGRDNRGLGAGSDPEVGAKAARDSLGEIESKLKGADVVIIAAGFGGGTGTGAVPIIAESAKASGALTLAIVTTPFLFEGPKRRRHAKEGIAKLSKHVDSYIVLSNDKLAKNYGEIPIEDTFELSNISLKNIILAIHDILYRIGRINIDYADVRKILVDSGITMVGIASATGKDRAEKAVEKAFDQNLYETVITKASKMLINIQHDRKTSLNEINRAITRAHEIFKGSYDADDEDFEVISGYELVDTKDNSEFFKVSIIVTGETSNDPTNLNKFNSIKPKPTITQAANEFISKETPVVEVEEIKSIEKTTEIPIIHSQEKIQEHIHMVDYKPIEDTFEQDFQTNEFSSEYFDEPGDEIPESVREYENVFGEKRISNFENNVSIFTPKTNDSFNKQNFLNNKNDTMEVNNYLSRSEEMSESEKKQHEENLLRKSPKDNDDWY
ncbi:cell division protein FtsZ [Mycoplasmopsis cricetuli]|uniref:cell division protein FtsZ n=1 Tax=Mycoplasmopsis cricetuli TaxID=171283 RepID=UPI00046F1F82|nr:cell division protein FtsZ [Mycoplasmopsis cricetuli]